MSASVTRTTARVPGPADVAKGLALVRRAAGGEPVDLALTAALSVKGASHRLRRRPPAALDTEPPRPRSALVRRRGEHPPPLPGHQARRSLIEGHDDQLDSSTAGGHSSWRSRGACRNIDPDTFFPPAHNGPQVTRAKAVCAVCAVRDRCLDEALQRIPEGIAGGLTATERRTLAHTRPPRADPTELARTARNRTETAAAGRLLLASGRSRATVARTCGVSERTVYRWSADLGESARPPDVLSPCAALSSRRASRCTGNRLDRVR